MDLEEAEKIAVDQAVKDITEEEDKRVVDEIDNLVKQEKDIWKQERMRYQFYGFLRRSRKPKKGEEKIIKFNPIKDEEDVMDYFNRCHKEVGARPAPVGPMKRIPVNSSCICKSGRKYKKCCGRGA